MRGNIVAANVDSDSFSISMLEKHLQIMYPNAVMIYDRPPWTRTTAEIHICFDNQEDAIAFHLSHTGGII
jgi:hypothetical protein